MKLKIKDRYFSIALFVLFVIYMLFTISDLSTSRQSGFKDVDRSDVYRYLILMTSYLFVYAVFNIKKLKLQQPLTSLVLMALWTILVNILNGVSVWVFLVRSNMAVLWCLSYIFFNRLRSKEGGGKSSIEICSYILLLFYVFATIYYFFDMMVRLKRIPVLNVVYYEMALLPWVLIVNSGKNKKWIYLLSMIVVMFSMKRGAVIAMVLMLLADSYINAKKTHSYKTFFRIVATVFLFTMAIILTDNLSGGFLSQRFSGEELTEGSGRAEQYSIIWEYIKDGDLLELMFGRGTEKSSQILGLIVHNEWLYFIFCFGLVGLFIYASLIGSFITKSVSELKKNSDLASACCTMTVLYFVLSMLSTTYNGYFGFWLFGFWGYLNAELEIRQNCQKQDLNGVKANGTM